MARSNQQRELQFAMDTDLLRLRHSTGEQHPALVGLTRRYHNLLRMWTDVRAALVAPTSDAPDRGTDVLKALALGGSAVRVRRSAIGDLSHAGAAGVAHVLRSLRDQLEVAMALTGAATPPDNVRDFLHLPDTNPKKSGAN